MHYRPLACAIAAVIGVHGQAVANTNFATEMESMKNAVTERFELIKTLTADSTQYQEHNGKLRFQFNGHLYDLNPDKNPIFFPFVDGEAYADRSAAAMFDFVQPPWKLVNQWDGVFIYHEQFGATYLNEDQQCNIQYLAGNAHDSQNVFSQTQDCQPLQTNITQAHGFIDELPTENHLDGDLLGHIRFIQNQTAFPSGNHAKEQQNVVSQREAMLVFTPMPNDNIVDLYVSVYQDGVLLEKRLMTPSSQGLNADRPKQDDRPDVRLSKRSYETLLPWQWVQKGVSFVFDAYDGRQGTLAANGIDFAPDVHLDLPMIRIGMLTDPPAAKQLETDIEHYGAELFQRFPIASMTIAPYAPIKLDKVVMSNGKVNVEYSEFDSPGVYSGDMREDITKSLIQLGIANANFGVSSSTPHQWQANRYPSIVIGHSRGRYKDKDGNVGDYSHGLSGGNGMVLLSGAVGNEVTHEMGHAFGLGHYPGGYANATHTATTEWGFDAYRSRFSDNLYWYGNVNGDYGYGDIQVTPYKTRYQYGADPMGGGRSDSNSSSYPLFTGYTSKRIQQNLQQKGHLAETNGVIAYQTWEQNQQRWVEMNTAPIAPSKQNVPVMTMVGFYDPQGTNTSYIYPALYGASGKVYDLPAPVAGQCWADVTYATHKQTIGLLGERAVNGLSNRLHINLDPSQAPQSMAVYCPETSLESIVRQEKLNEYGQERFYSWGENNRNGTVGDVFEYHRGGRVEFYQLKTSRYWYFPGSGYDNGDWKFLGYLDQWIDDKRPDLPFDALGKVLRDERTLDPNFPTALKPFTVGKGKGYAEALSKQKTFTQLSALSQQDFATFTEFDAWIATKYGQPFIHYNHNVATPKRGDIHMQANEEGKRLYFLRTQISNTSPPTQPQSNADWHYLGTGDDWVNLSLNPLAFQWTSPLNLEQQLANAFNQTRLYQNGDQPYWHSQGSHFVFGATLTDGQRGYFLQQTPNTTTAIPTAVTSTNEWRFLGTQSQWAQWIEENRNDVAIFEQRLAQWHKQERIQDWSGSGRGTANDIYRYAFRDGKTHYYRLKDGNYWYYPHPVAGNTHEQNSNHDWEYLGHF